SASFDHLIVSWRQFISSIYHTLHTQLHTRLGRGSQLQVSYTWSKTIGDVPLDYSGGIADTNSITDLARPSLDRGLARTDRRHIFNASLVLMLPTLDGKSGFAKNVFGDWEIASIAQAASGIPLTVFTTGVPGL